jgi:hypothetical protein
MFFLKPYMQATEPAIAGDYTVNQLASPNLLVYFIADIQGSRSNG